MIRPRVPATPEAVARHYDDLDVFYREIWGEHLHHGLFRDPWEPPQRAAARLVDRVGERAGIGPGNRVCDIGCGYGAPARRWAERRGARVTGVTLSEAQHRWATREGGAAAGIAGAGTDRRHRVHPGRVDGGPTASPPAPDRAGRRGGRGVNPALSGGGDATARGAPVGGEGSVEFLLGDWLTVDLGSDRFDAVVAIESTEHVEDRPALFRRARRVLRPGGRMVVCAWLARPDPPEWQVRHLLEPICREGRLAGLGTVDEHLAWMRDAGFADLRVDDVTRAVRATWPASAAGMVRGLVSRPSYRRFVLDRSQSNRVFARTVFRIWAAYRVGALRYGIFTGTAG